MFNNVVVGVDDREGGRDAIALARALLAEDGELTLAYVFHGSAQIWRAPSPAHDVAEHEHARELLERASEEAGVAANLRWRSSPSVGRGLHELAEGIEADLLVVGSSRSGLLGRVLVGNDTRAALNGSPCAIALAPAGHSQRPVLMREIGVGYDGSPESRHALEVARALAAQHHAKLSAFEAVSIPTYAFTAGSVPVGDWIGGLVQDARDRIAALGDVEPHAVYGQPAEELAMYSASIDLLVVGSRGYGPIGRLVHGSTTQQLARLARCPVLALTRAARDIDTSGTSKDDQDAGIGANA